MSEFSSEFQPDVIMAQQAMNTSEPEKLLDISRRERVANTLRAGVIAVEVFPPTSGGLRYGALAVAEMHSSSPLVGAATLGLATLALEWGSYRAGVDWIADNKIAPVMDGIRERIQSYHDSVVKAKDSLNTDSPRLKPGRFIPNIPTIPESPEHGAKIPLAAQGIIALQGGTVVLLSAKQEVDRSRGIEVNKRDGRASIALVTGYLALQGAIISGGIDFVKEDVVERGTLLLGLLAAGTLAWKIAKNKLATCRKDSKDEL